jgi:hypothetical protein
MPGVGRMVRRGPYEVIEDMHMPTGDFVLRIGSPGVDHKMVWRGTRTNLSALAPHVAVQFSATPVSWLYRCGVKCYPHRQRRPQHLNNLVKRKQTFHGPYRKTPDLLKFKSGPGERHRKNCAGGGGEPEPLPALHRRHCHPDGTGPALHSLRGHSGIDLSAQTAFRSARKDRLNLWVVMDWVLVAASVYCTAYICINLTEIFERQGDWLPADLMVGIIGTLLVLEACRRVIGVIMTGICSMAMLYAYFGQYMPELIIHKGYSIERIATTLWLTTEGIFGLPIGVAATFVFVFVLFGAFLESTGGGNFFIELAYALTGRFSGGPAKTSVVASGFMGSVSGSAVGNVVATGSFTIPMMKKVGYRPHVAGAIEAAASTGGQLMPPIMGAGAFLMAEFTNTSYLTIIKVALVPAIMYYVTVLFSSTTKPKNSVSWANPKKAFPGWAKWSKKGCISSSPC